MRDADDIIDRALTGSINGYYGKLGSMLQHVGRAYRPGLWHLMKADPHDKFDGWRWDHTWHVSGDSDPCDEWPYIMVGGELVCFTQSFSLRHYAERLKNER